VDDIGNVINPLIVEGQVHGGLAQGIAQALFEEANYDEQGTLVNGTFVDYTLPSRRPTCPASTPTAPRRRRRRTRWASRASARRARSPPTPRIVNGVLDAVRHLGVTAIEMPTTSQRVWRAIQDAKGHATEETPVDTHSPGPGWAPSTRTTPGRGPVIPAKFDYVKPASVEEAVSGVGRGRRGRQDHRGRPEPAAGAAAAAGGRRRCSWTSAGSRS
jgi:hypothetical protein